REVERAVRDALEVACIAFMEAKIPEPGLRGPLVACLDEVAGDVDAGDVGAELRERERRGAVAAAQVQHLDRRFDAERAGHRLAGLAHECGDRGEVALLPECLVRIHGFSIASWTPEENMKRGAPRRGAGARGI